MNTSKSVNNAQAIVGIILTLLPWVLRIFGVDIPDIQGGSDISSELAASVTGTAILAKANPISKA